MGIDKSLDVQRPTATRLGTVLVPVQDGRGRGFVFELTRSMWLAMRSDIDAEFRRIDHQAETAAAILNIERHDSVV